MNKVSGGIWAILVGGLQFSMYTILHAIWTPFLHVIRNGNVKEI